MHHLEILLLANGSGSLDAGVTKTALFGFGKKPNAMPLEAYLKNAPLWERDKQKLRDRVHKLPKLPVNEAQWDVAASHLIAGDYSTEEEGQAWERKKQKTAGSVGGREDDYEYEASTHPEWHVRQFADLVKDKKNTGRVEHVLRFNGGKEISSFHNPEEYEPLHKMLILPYGHKKWKSGEVDEHVKDMESYGSELRLHDDPIKPKKKSIFRRLFHSKTASERLIAELALGKLAFDMDDAKRVLEVAKSKEPGFWRKHLTSLALKAQGRGGTTAGFAVDPSDVISGKNYASSLQRNLGRFKLNQRAKSVLHPITSGLRSSEEMRKEHGVEQTKGIINFLVGKRPYMYAQKGKAEELFKKHVKDLPKLDKPQSSMLHSIVSGHELDELAYTKAKSPATLRFGHNAPGVIYRESNRVGSLSPSLKPAGDYMRAVRSGAVHPAGNEARTLFSKIDPRLEYGSTRLSRHAIKSLTDIAERKAVTGK